MWDASRERSAPGRKRLVGAAAVAGLFGLFKRRPDSADLHVEVALPREPAAAPMATAPPVVPLEQMLRQDLRFKGLHEDVNPAANIRPAEMTCPNCERRFRYFQNSNGVKTVARCPGCARQFRV